MDETENLRALLAFKGQYHNHKENMAHAAMLLQIGFFAAMIKIEACLPEWLNFLRICESELVGYVLVFVGYLVIWGIITWYMEWQFRLRKIAASQVDELIKAIKVKSEEDLRPLIQKMEDVRGSTQKPIMSEWIVRLANFLILLITLFKIGFLC